MLTFEEQQQNIRALTVILNPLTLFIAFNFIYPPSQSWADTKRPIQNKVNKELGKQLFKPMDAQEQHKPKIY